MKEITDHNKIESLYFKFITGVANKQDLDEIQEACLDAPALKQRFAEAEKVIKKTESYKLMKEVDTSSAFQKLSGRIKEYRAQKSWFYYWQKVAAVLLLPVVIISGVQFWLLNDKEAPSETKTTEVVYNTLNTTPGLRSTFVLPDGTKVWLNGSTKLTYPMTFTGHERRIKLEGEAYFEVAKNKEKPFIVDAGQLTVQALGTEFNCMAYADGHRIETALAEGKVKVTRIQDGKEKGEYFLNPGQMISYDSDDDKFYLTEENFEKYISWRSGKFVFRNDPMEDVCQKLGRWFNAEIIIRDESLKNYAFTGTFQEEGLTEIFDLISLTSPIGYTVTKRKVNDQNEYGTLKIEIMKNN